MRITIERTGGLAGINQVLATYDTDELTKDEVDAVHRAATALAAAFACGVTAEIGADLITYRVAIDDTTYDIAGEAPPELTDPLSVLLRQNQ
jgi:hypothetical protein